MKLHKKSTLNEVLQYINDHIESLHKEFAVQPGSPLQQIFAHSFDKDWKLRLPNGIPPYNPSTQRVGMHAIDLMNAIRRGRLTALCNENLSALRREQLFINLLEGVYSEEAKVLIAIKDQTLTALYPNITAIELVKAKYLPMSVLDDSEIKILNEVGENSEVEQVEENDEVQSENDENDDEQDDVEDEEQDEEEDEQQQFDLEGHVLPYKDENGKRIYYDENGNVIPRSTYFYRRRQAKKLLQQTKNEIRSKKISQTLKARFQKQREQKQKEDEQNKEENKTQN